jgi:hypothetical protein
VIKKDEKVQIKEVIFKKEQLDNLVLMSPFRPPSELHRSNRSLIISNLNFWT